MSFPGRGRSGRRGRRAAFGTFAVALFVWQALTLVGAVPAGAAVATCSFSGGVLNLTITGAGPDDFQQDAAGNILVDGAKTSTYAGCTVSVDATTANTTSISVTGDSGDNVVLIDTYSTAGKTVSWGTIDWVINLASNTTSSPGDSLTVDNSGGDAALKLTLGASGIDLNNDSNLDVTMSGVESVNLTGGPKGDTLSAGGSTATGAAFPTKVTITGNAGADTLTGGTSNDTITGDAGDDTIAGGLGDDTLTGGVNTLPLVACDITTGDTVDYSSSAAAVLVTLNVNATGQGVDTLTTFENVIGSKQGDTLTGDAGDNVIQPGAGDDKVDGAGNAAVGDSVDYEDATAAVTVDLTKGTATGGSGNDTLSHFENACGSAFDDTLTGDDTPNVLAGNEGNDTIAGMGDDTTATGDSLEGDAGIDTVDYSWSVDDTVSVTLDDTSCTVAVVGKTVYSGTSGFANDALTTLEDAILTPGDDTFKGNQFANRVWPFGGQNSLLGDNGGVGCSTSGGDTVDYSQGYDAGVTVNMAGGGTAGDSAVGFENAVGTAFADSFTGNDVSNTIQAGGGNDTIRGGGGDDTLKGGKGNDTVRGGAGDDDMYGGKGKKDAGYGGGGTDLCKGFETRKGCEIH